MQVLAVEGRLIIGKFDSVAVLLSVFRPKDGNFATHCSFDAIPALGGFFGGVSFGNFAP